MMGVMILFVWGVIHLFCSPPVRRASADVVSVIAKHAIPAGEWPELLPFLHQCSQSAQEEHREVRPVLSFFLYRWMNAISWVVQENSSESSRILSEHTTYVIPAMPLPSSSLDCDCQIWERCFFLIVALWRPFPECATLYLMETESCRDPSSLQR
jgi:hypothetical protein